MDSITRGRSVIRDVDLSGIIVGPFAILKELKSANLFESKISNTDLSCSHISGSLNSSSLTNVRLEESRLDGVLLCNAQIHGCNFSKSRLAVNMDGSTCEETRFTKARYTTGSSGMEYGGRRVKFINCDFTGAFFDRVEFRASRFINCIFTGARFKSCDLRGAKFEGGVLPLATQFENMEAPT